MWSFGHFTLKLPRGFFNEYTMREYNLLHDRWVESEANPEFRTSLLVATLRNINRPNEGIPLLPDDHFMRYPFKKSPTELAEISPALMHEKLKYAFGSPDPQDEPDAGGASIDG